MSTPSVCGKVGAAGAARKARLQRLETSVIQSSPGSRRKGGIVTEDYLNYLCRYQMWRTGQDERTMDEAGLTPRGITEAIDKAVAEISRSRREKNEAERG